MHLPSLRSLFALAVTLALSAPCHALPVERNLLELVDDAEDVVIFTVERVEGPEYGRRAIGRVERSFKGRIRGALDLPFRYKEWPEGSGMVFVGCDMGISFEAGTRYVAVLQAASAHANGLNPWRARTAYEVVPLDNAFYVEGDLGMPGEALEGFVRASRAKGSARISRLSELVRHTSERVRLEAVACLRNESSPLASPLLLERMKDDRTESVRVSAARAFAERPGEDVTAALFATLEREQSKLVRSAVVTGLGRRGDRASIIRLVSAFPAADPDLQNTMVATLSEVAEPWLLPDLIRIHGLARTEYSRQTSLLAIGSVGTADATRFLTSVAMGSGDRAERTTALHALARAGRSGPVEEILALAELPCTAENDQMLDALVRTVATIGEPEQVQEVCRKLRACTERETQAAVSWASSQSSREP